MKKIAVIAITGIILFTNITTAFAGTWISEGPSWKYKKDDGNVAISEWISDGGEWYHFDENCVLQTGWILDSEKWYFLGSNGAMFKNMKTPKGHYVGNDGAWIENPQSDSDSDSSSSSSSGSGGGTSSGGSGGGFAESLQPGTTSGPGN